jgi:hypothetical protein
MHKCSGRAVFLATSLYFILAGSVSYAISDCTFAGVNFSDGAVSCQSGHQFSCSDGDWKPIDLACPNATPGPAPETSGLCRCTDAEATACDQTGQGCCVSVIAGSCVKSCCPKQ